MGYAGMSYLIIKNKSSGNISYSGTNFTGLESVGAHHLCIRTGTGESGVIRYGFTSSPLNDKYRCLRMRISNGTGVMEAYIAQRYSVSGSASSSKSYTTTRTSGFTSSQTLSTASKSSLSTKTTTRTSRFTSSQTLTTVARTSLVTQAATRTATRQPVYYGSIKSTSYLKFQNKTGVNNPVIAQNVKMMRMSSGTTYQTSFTFMKTAPANVQTATFVPIWYEVTRTLSTMISNYTSSKTLSTASKSSLSTKTATRTSKYTSSQTLKTVSKSSLITKLTTRSSQYSTSSNTSTTNSIITNNVNL